MRVLLALAALLAATQLGGAVIDGGISCKVRVDQAAGRSDRASPVSRCRPGDPCPQHTLCRPYRSPLPAPTWYQYYTYRQITAALQTTGTDAAAISAAISRIATVNGWLCKRCGKTTAMNNATFGTIDPLRGECCESPRARVRAASLGSGPLQRARLRWTLRGRTYLARPIGACSSCPVLPLCPPRPRPLHSPRVQAWVRVGPVPVRWP